MALMTGDRFTFNVKVIITTEGEQKINFIRESKKGFTNMQGIIWRVRKFNGQEVVISPIEDTMTFTKYGLFKKVKVSLCKDTKYLITKKDLNNLTTAL